MVALSLLPLAGKVPEGRMGGNTCDHIARRTDSVAVTWRQQFTKASGDFVAKMVLVQVGGKHLADHAMVF